MSVYSSWTLWFSTWQKHQKLPFQADEYGICSRYLQKWSSLNIQIEWKCAKGTVNVQVKPLIQHTKPFVKVFDHTTNYFNGVEVASLEAALLLGTLIIRWFFAETVLDWYTDRPQLFHNILSSDTNFSHEWIYEPPQFGTTVEKTKLIQARSVVTHDLQPDCGPIPYSGYNECRLLLNYVARCLTYWLNSLLPVLKACKVVSTASAIWIICHGFPPNGQFIEGTIHLAVSVLQAQRENLLYPSTSLLFCVYSRVFCSVGLISNCFMPADIHPPPGHWNINFYSYPVS